MIKIVGLGPGSKDAMTIGTLEALRTSKNLYFRTEKHPNVEYLRSLGIEFKTYDHEYEAYDNFEQVYSSIVKDIVAKAKLCQELVYAVPGHPLVAEKTVIKLIEQCKCENLQYEILPAVSFIDALIESLKIDPIEGLKIIDAFDIKNQVLDKRTGIVITQVYEKYIASEVKLALMEYYKDDTEIFFVRAAGVKGEESTRKMKLYELDRQLDIDHLTSIYIPKQPMANKDFYDLLNIMETLRGEAGCAWDKEQTHETLRKYLIEECYEVIAAIDNNDDENLVEELGDVLLQVVFHAQIGKEYGYFNIYDIIKAISDKMINRHPHVFGELKINTSEEVLETWDKIKKEEKALSTYTEELKNIPKVLPALIRSEKVQKKAAKVGFDWDKVEDALDKVIEEYHEVKNVYKGNDRAKILEEIGDLLFSVVNVARFLDIDPEFALNYTIEKFIKRFEYIEETAVSQNLKLEEMSLEEMDKLWEQAKKL